MTTTAYAVFRNGLVVFDYRTKQEAKYSTIEAAREYASILNESPTMKHSIDGYYVDKVKKGGRKK